MMYKYYYNLLSWCLGTIDETNQVFIKMDFNIPRLIQLIMLAAILLMTSMCNGDGIDVENKCLFDNGQKMKEPIDDCGALVSYRRPMGLLLCDVQFPNIVAFCLESRPEEIKVKLTDAMRATLGKRFPTPILLLMFDPDVPLPDPAIGFVHWVVKGSLNEDGVVTLSKSEEMPYFPPSPPEGQNHRYQVFIFSFEADKKIQPNPSEVKNFDKFCAFVNRNGLDVPLASTQFRYQSEIPDRLE